MYLKNETNLYPEIQTRIIVVMFSLDMETKGKGDKCHPSASSGSREGTEILLKAARVGTCPHLHCYSLSPRLGRGHSANNKMQQPVRKPNQLPPAVGGHLSRDTQLGQGHAGPSPAAPGTASVPITATSGSQHSKRDSVYIKWPCWAICVGLEMTSSVAFKGGRSPMCLLIRETT